MTTPTYTPIPVPTMVRNNERGPAVFEADGFKVEWAGAGDIMGGDIQPIPEKMLSSVQFHQMVIRGIFAIEQGGEAIQGALDAQRREYETRMARQRSASEAAMDTSRTDDSLMVECVGPATVGAGKCGTPTPQKVSEMAVKPPLCPQHAGLAGQYVAEEIDGKVVGGKAPVKWMPIRLGHTERQS